ncbi:MAG TPA: 4Fe-4S binding protein [Chitinispirillaceae bacterium]|nr:4Fe-4S binding protein [Chitinispirillaceae bacterium]
MSAKSRRRSVVITIVFTFITLMCGCMQSQSSYLTVQSNKCTGCRACEGVCRVDALRFIDGKAVIDPTKCVECGRCVEVCPSGAIY